MLIISKFHDYYDSATNGVVDKTIVFTRTKTVEKSPDLGVDTGWSGLNLPEGNRYTRYSSSNKPLVSYDWFVIGFCGLLYIGLKETLGEPSYSPVYKPSIINFYYGEDCLLPFQENRTTKNSDYSRVEEYLRLLHTKENTSLFVKYNSPIFYIGQISGEGRSLKCEINPQLKDFEFFKVKDSFTAFQEIQSYISGVLGIDNSPISNLTDKEKIIQHGFDLKWGFRNPNPPKRKQKI